MDKGDYCILAMEKWNLKNFNTTCSTAKMKYLEIKLTKYVWNLYVENYKILMKEIKDEHGSIYHVHGLENWILR